VRSSIALDREASKTRLLKAINDADIVRLSSDGAIGSLEELLENMTNGPSPDPRAKASSTAVVSFANNVLVAQNFRRFMNRLTWLGIPAFVLVLAAAAIAKAGYEQSPPKLPALDIRMYLTDAGKSKVKREVQCDIKGDIGGQLIEGDLSAGRAVIPAAPGCVPFSFSFDRKDAVVLQQSTSTTTTTPPLQQSPPSSTP
jgi:hypothetical protein